MNSTKKYSEILHCKEDKIKVVMTLKVYNQIKYLCAKISQVEWSGILFYKPIEGSIEKPEELTLELVDILLMDKGSQSFTAYTFDASVIEHMENNPELEECKMGHIHSHNTMNVFFSGTDMSELEDNSPNHNYYLSLIVNNFMQFMAKVSFVITGEEELKYQLKARNEEGLEYVYMEETVSQKTEKMVHYDCEIIRPGEEVDVTPSFCTRVEEIIKKAPARTVTYGGYNQEHKQAGYQYNGYGQSKKIDEDFKFTPGGTYDAFDDINDDYPLANNKKKVEGIHQLNTQEKEVNTPTNSKVRESKLITDPIDVMVAQMNDDVKAWYTGIEHFSLYILDQGDDYESMENPIELIQHFSLHGYTAEMMLDSVTNFITDSYNRFFKYFLATENDAEKRKKHFQDVLSDLVKEYDYLLLNQTNSVVSEYLEPIKDFLNHLLHTFKTAPN